MKNTIRNLTAAALVAASFSALAATQGTQGSDSTGTIEIDLTLTPQIIIGGLEDVSLDETTTSDAQLVCVGGFGFENYSVEFGSLNGNAKVGTANSTAPFLLAGTTVNTETVPYSVEYTNDTAASNGIASTDGTVGSTFTRANSLSECTGVAPTSNNGQIFISVDSADWTNVSDSAFTDTLTVTVTAQ